jgi:PAS domain S-box-containing protein
VSGDRTHIWGAVRVVIAYAVLSSAWIYFSDAALTRAVHSEKLFREISILKDVVFVIISSVLALAVMLRAVRRTATSQQALAEKAEKLQQRETFLSLQFERAPVGCIVWDKDFTVKNWNPAAEQIFGYSADDAIGMHAHDFLPESAKKHVDLIWHRLKMGDDKAHSVNENVTADGRVILCEWTNTPLFDVHGRPLGALSMIQDITEKQRANEELHKLEQDVQHAQRLESLGALAGGVAHDMNNILASIIGVAETAQMLNPDNEKLQRHLDMVMRAAFRGRDLVKGLTNFARKEVAQTVPVDLNAIAGSEKDLLSRTTLQRIEVVADLEPNLPIFEGDANAITNAVMNLCVNAVDAMPNGGVLTLKTRRANGWAEVAITDTGKGMTPGVKQRALEPFFTTKPFGKGTGLGLSMVYGTVKAHGGSVFIESEVGHGTTVTMRFPHGAAAAKPAPAVVTDRDRRSAGKLRILLVDDDEMVQEAVPAMLQALGHKVDVATRGQLALEMLKTGGVDPDLIVLDLNMPGMTGFETLHHIREFSNVPVIIATGYLDKGIEIELRSAVNVRTLSKPFSLAEFKKAFAWAMEI